MGPNVFHPNAATPRAVVAAIYRTAKKRSAGLALMLVATLSASSLTMNPIPTGQTTKTDPQRNVSWSRRDGWGGSDLRGSSGGEGGGVGVVLVCITLGTLKNIPQASIWKTLNRFGSGRYEFVLPPNASAGVAEYCDPAWPVIGATPGHKGSGLLMSHQTGDEYCR